MIKYIKIYLIYINYKLDTAVSCPLDTPEYILFLLGSPIESIASRLRLNPSEY